MGEVGVLSSVSWMGGLFVGGGQWGRVEFVVGRSCANWARV